MKTLKQIYSVLEKNRWSFICPAMGFIVWIYASIGCVATASNPLQPEQQVNAVELQRIYETVLSDRLTQDKKFQWTADDIQKQQEQFTKIQETLLKIASGSVTDWSGLLQLLVSGGVVGFFADNVRKNGVIAGLKINKS